MTFFLKKSLPIFLIAIHSVSSVFALEKKCEAEKLIGTWYGTYTLVSTGNEYMMVLEITSTDKCTFEGNIHWPDYFNSKALISGEIIDNEIRFFETKLLQGFHQEFTGNYSFTTDNNEVADGKWKDKTNTLKANFQLTKAEKLNEEQLNELTISIETNIALNGTASILEEVQGQEPVALLSELREKSTSFGNIKQLTMSGTAKMKNVEFPMHIYYLHPDHMRIDMTIQNMDFIYVKNMDSTWGYNPFDDVVTVNIIENDEDDDNSNVAFDLKSTDIQKLLDEGYLPVKVENAILDSINTYRFTLKNDDNTIILFLDRNNGNILRKENNEAAFHLLGYQSFEGESFPTLFYDIKENNVNQMRLNSFSSKQNVDPAMFVLTPDLRKKIKVNETLSHKAYHDEGIAFFKEGKYEDALGQFDKAINLNGRNAGYYFDRGNTRKMLEDYYGAVSDFNKAIEINPNHALAHNYKGVAIYSLNDYKNSVAPFTKAIEIDSTYEDAYSNRGNAYYLLEEFDKSMADFKKLVELYPEEGKYYYFTGLLLEELEMHEDALEYFEKAIELEYIHSEVWNRKGIAQYSMEDYTNALESFMKSIELDSTDYVKYSNAASTLVYLEEYEASIDFLQKALVLSPENDGVYNDLGYSYYLTDDYSEAVNMYDKAISIYNEDATYFDNRAFAKTGLMDYMGAIEDLNTSIDLYSGDPEVYYQRGLLKITINNQHDGCRDLKKAFDLGHEGAGEKIEENCILLKEGK